MDYRKLLEYYLTSDEWEFEIISFFEVWNHHFDPTETLCDQVHGKAYVASDVYLEFEKKLADAGGSYFNLQLNKAQFEKYFDSKYSAHQRFAVLFAMWWRLKESQIKHIANLQQKKLCEYWLNFFLCNPDVEQPTLSTEELLAYNYSGKYHSVQI